MFIESVVVKKINEALIPTAHIKLKQIKEVSNSSGFVAQIDER
ncbi:hypothetical protein J497_02591 [Acinetobacter baumannii 1121032]|nr:hypothetical protein J497_02591 [Acinetobacter baumannii 1121032]